MADSAIGSNWEDFEKEIFTAEEITEMDEKLAAELSRIKALRERKKARHKQLNKLHLKNSMMKKIY